MRMSRTETYQDKALRKNTAQQVLLGTMKLINYVEPSAFLPLARSCGSHVYRSTLVRRYEPQMYSTTVQHYSITGIILWYIDKSVRYHMIEYSRSHSKNYYCCTLIRYCDAVVMPAPLAQIHVELYRVPLFVITLLQLSAERFVRTNGVK